MKAHGIDDIRTKMDKGNFRDYVKVLYMETTINTLEESIIPEVTNLLIIISTKMDYDILNVIGATEQDKILYLLSVNGTATPSYKNIINNIELLLYNKMHTAKIYSILIEIFHESTLLLNIFRDELKGIGK